MFTIHLSLLFSYWNVTPFICLANRYFTRHNTMSSSARKRIPILWGLKFIIFSTASSRIRWSDSSWSRLKHLLSNKILCVANDQGMGGGHGHQHRHTNHLTLLIFRREWDNVTCTSEKRKYERRIYGLWKIPPDNLVVKNESLTLLVRRNGNTCWRRLYSTRVANDVAVCQAWR